MVESHGKWEYEGIKGFPRTDSLSNYESSSCFELVRRAWNLKSCTICYSNFILTIILVSFAYTSAVIESQISNKKQKTTTKQPSPALRHNICAYLLKFVNDKRVL